MLSQEEIYKRIDSTLSRKAWVQTRTEKVRRLKSDTRTIGEMLVESGKKSKRGDFNPWHARHKIQTKLYALSDTELLALCDAMLPHIAKEFRDAWKLLENLPIQEGYERKPFRTPGNAELLHQRRARFLASIMDVFEGRDAGLEWLATYGSHLTEYSASEDKEDIGILLAAAINRGGKQAEDIIRVLKESAEGLHEAAKFDQHVVGAFLCSNDRSCWEYIEKLLLAAQRQEGLRQVILESVDFTNPDAFRRMLRVIIDNNLSRFSSVVRAFDVWLGFQLDSQSARYVNDTIETLAKLLDDESARTKVLSGDDAEAAYLALWCIAFDDASATVKPAAKLLKHKKPEMRFIGLHVLNMLGIPEHYEHVVPAVDDSDPRVAVFAASVARTELERRSEAKADATVGRNAILFEPAEGAGDLFERLVKLHDRLPAKAQEAKPLVWPWMKFKVTRQEAADGLLAAIEKRPLSAVTPYVTSMSPDGRQQFAKMLSSRKSLEPDVRLSLLKLVGDASSTVRESAVGAARKLKITQAEVPELEALLARKASDLRRSVLAMILTMKDAKVMASAQRLTESKNAQQRLAGLDLLQQMKKGGRAKAASTEVAEKFQAKRGKVEKDEQVYLNQLTQSDSQKAWTLDDALGLMDNAKRTPPIAPTIRDVRLGSPAGAKLLSLIDAAVHERRETPVKLPPPYGNDSELKPLGSVQWGFPGPFEFDHDSHTWRKRTRDELPLAEVWQKIWETRPKEARDTDGLEAARARIMCIFQDEFRSRSHGQPWDSIAKSLLGDTPKLKYPQITTEIVEWLAAEATADLAAFGVDGYETVLASIPTSHLADPHPYGGGKFRHFADSFGPLIGDFKCFSEHKGTWKLEHDKRLFEMFRWKDEPSAVPVESKGFLSKNTSKLVKAATPTRSPAKIVRSRVGLEKLAKAFDCKWANEHDVYDALLGPGRTDSEYSRFHGFSELYDASKRLYKGEYSPAVSQLVRTAIDRVLEIELERGETETIATPAALALQYAGGADVLVRILSAIGRDPKLQRNYSWGDQSKSKSAVFSHLIQVTMPGKNETPEAFAKAVKVAEISEDALLAVAFYAPQWSRHVEAALGWDSFADAVWWFHAHTKDNQWRVDDDIRESWNAEIRKLTPLTLEDLVEGAVDVDWFDRVSKSIGEKRWKRMDGFAKYACRGAGHKRAQLFADAMSGRIKRADLFKEIESKRKQDSVRALGLVPLEKDAKKDVLERYKAMQEFVRTCRQFGSQRQASEKLAARIGQENLARTAGYPDPIRLQWAMEGLATADLARGPVTASVGDVMVQLAIDEEGLPEISVRRGEKALKSIPPDVKKNEDVQTLTERKTELRRSASRMRQSLELAMCRGDRFSGDELCELWGNVMLRPMLNRLVFAGDGILGYPEKEGKCLRDFEGRIEPIKKTEMLRLAHPVDFLASKAWTKWQRDCFAAERVQPFKQIFRELYVLTEQEKSDKTFSRRYAGQQVNPRQALALLGSRGWVTAPEAGVFRAYHDEKLVAWIEFMETFYTPAEVEGLTLEKVRFAKRGTDEPLSLSEVPPRLLSETLRDVDLIVSVAHRGGVDPEASASTVEMRSALLGETIKLLKLDNVRIKDSHAYIKGDMAEYSVHLGSATTHMLPGGALFIVPVHSQHRGRIFLPFADEDPKMAEIVSKVLLLARDREIKDPNLINQIRGSQ